jgi:hypothetical protein
MTEPRNVTPDEAWPEGKPAEPAATDSAGTTAKTATPQPEWWTGGWDGRERTGFPVLGVLLVVIGLGLLFQWFFPQVGAGTLILMTLGVAFLGAWLTGRSWFAMVPGFLLLALGIGELLEDLAVFKPAHEDVPGLAATALAIGFLAIFVVARLGKRRWIWPLWAAAIFGIIGLAQLSTFVVLPQIGGALVPVLIIVLGVIVLFNWRRERA